MVLSYFMHKILHEILISQSILITIIIIPRSVNVEVPHLTGALGMWNTVLCNETLILEASQIFHQITTKINIKY